MTITLKPEWQKYVEEQVQSGRFASAEDVLSAALYRLQQDEKVGDFGPGELDALLAVGKAQLDRGEGHSMQEVREHFRKRAADESARPGGAK
jgi:antitoxin ParD1/3/4